MRRRTAFALLLAGFAIAVPVVVTPSAAAQPVSDEPVCATTGHLVEDGRDPRVARDELAAQEVLTVHGVGWEQTDRWVVPDGAAPLVVVDSSEPLSDLTVEVYVAGVRVHRWESVRAQATPRFAADPTLPPLGDLTRVVGVTVESGPCVAATVVTVDRALWSTWAGRVGLALTALLAAALVTVARWWRGGWWRRFLWSAPVGLLAGAAQVVVLHESGRLDPFGSVPWWPFAAGLAVAGLLPLTRRRRDRRPAGRPPAAATLRQLVASGVTLTGPQAVTLTLGVLAELSTAHARGVVQGVRPETIWLDRDGRVRLAEPGPAGPPYASPEQTAGRPGDARSDLWACAAVLTELLTGRPPTRSDAPVPPAAPPPPDLRPLPGSLAEVLRRALSDDPAERFESAETFAAALRAAAEREWGPDWAGRGALAGALLAHGAIGSAAGGYVAGGYVVGGPGAGAQAGVAGLGTAVPAGTGALGSAGAGVVGGAGGGGLGGAATTGVTLVTAGPALAGGAVAGAATGKAGALVSVAAAVAAAVAVGTGAVVSDVDPAQARSPVVTPAQARVVAVRVLDEARSDNADHLAERVAEEFDVLLDRHPELRDSTLAEVAVGVPPDQYGYPAWFVASAQFRFDGGVVHVLGRFERAELAAAWRMVTVTWLSDEPVGRPRADADGWLLPRPQAGELIVDPAELPRRYADWLQANIDADRQVEDDLLRPVELGEDRESIRDYLLRVDYLLPPDMSASQETVPGDAEPDVVWLADGGALVSFDVISREYLYNTPTPGRTLPCDEARYFMYTDTDWYRQLSRYVTVRVDAWVPPRDSGRATVLIADPVPAGFPPGRLDPDRSIPC